MDRKRRRPGLLVATAGLSIGLISGCGTYLPIGGGPTLDDAPAQVRDRSELPTCGRTVSGYLGVSSDDGAPTCFRDADLAERPAEYLWFFSSDAGQLKMVFRIEADGSRVVFTNTDPSGAWAGYACERFTYPVDPDLGGIPNFDPSACTRIDLGAVVAPEHEHPRPIAPKPLLESRSSGRSAAW